MGSELVQGRTDERVVEYPFVLKNLEGAKSILDVGCLESGLSKFLCEKGFFVVGIDLREFHPVVNFVRCDARLLPFKCECFDLAIAVSTLEHVGMICYGLERWRGYTPDPQGDRKSLDEMARVSKKMVITLPYGASKGDYWIRYYNQDSLAKLLHGLDFEAEYYLKHGAEWRPCSEEEASQMPSGEGALAQAVVCVKVVK